MSEDIGTEMDREIENAKEQAAEAAGQRRGVNEAKNITAPVMSRAEQIQKIAEALSRGSPIVWETFQALYGGKALVRKVRDAVEGKIMIENIGTEIDREIENAKREAARYRRQADEALKKVEKLERSDHAMREYIKSLGVDPDEVIGAQA